MPKKNRTDVLELITKFQTKVLNNKPSMQEMFDDIRMMKFRIKPVQGDISSINLHDKGFIETLWSLGKLEEFFQTNISSLPLAQKNVFFRLFDDIYKKFHSQLNGANLKHESPSDNPSVLEMEIFKDKQLKVN
ncbi:MAG: hypothetical protein RI947_763 [Candidatus Parcubacteria bacterium]|jgi:hypothetical protein